MPPARKSYRRRVPRKPRKAYRKSTRPGRTLNVPDVASLSETTDFGALTVNSVYSFNDVQLGQFKRASLVAQGYQMFRIKSLCYKIQPLLDTFASTGGTQVPYLYWAINRAGNSFPILNKAWFIAQGAKGIRFDDKEVTIRYAPTVLLDAAEAGVPGVANQLNMPRKTPWLTTNREAFANIWNPSVVSHCGHFMAIYSEGSADPMNYRITLTAEIEFKKPLAKLPDASDVGVSSVINATALLTHA